MKNSSTSEFRLVIAGAAATVLLVGCGLAETSAVAASQAATAAEEVKQGKDLEEKVQRDVAAAEQAAAEARTKAEAGNE
jgi:hypothetical protein